MPAYVTKNFIDQKSFVSLVAIEFGKLFTTIMLLLLLLLLLSDFVAEYEETSTTALTVNPAVVVPLLTINGWILMQRKVTGGSVSFNHNWTTYRDGFGSATGNDKYWLGLDKVYRLVQLGSVRLRVEV